MKFVILDWFLSLSFTDFLGRLVLITPGVVHILSNDFFLEETRFPMNIRISWDFNLFVHTPLGFIEAGLAVLEQVGNTWADGSDSGIPGVSVVVVSLGTCGILASDTPGESLDSVGLSWGK